MFVLCYQKRQRNFESVQVDASPDDLPVLRASIEGRSASFNKAVLIVQLRNNKRLFQCERTNPYPVGMIEEGCTSSIQRAIKHSGP